MELREINDDADEIEELLSGSQRDDNEVESYFVEYAIQKEIINRNRLPASRRLLGQAVDNNLNSSPQHQNNKDTSWGAINFVHLPAPEQPPSRKREEAEALENLRKKVGQSKMCKLNPVYEKSSILNNQKIEQLDNRPRLLHKILITQPISITHNSNEFETDWLDSEFITECLCWHNVYRQRHNVTPLTMSPQLCEYAQTWANHLAHTNVFYYRNDKTVGQNLYCKPGTGSLSELDDVTGQDVAAYWYSAVKQYDFFKEPANIYANINAGHFTQMVWRNSKSFGVGKARSRSGKIIVVAYYQPVGNIYAHFRRNVLPPLPESMISPPQPRVYRAEQQISDGSVNSST